MDLNRQITQTCLNTIKRDNRLDLIKAISISLVLFLHLRPIRIVTEEAPNNYVRISSFILDQLYLNLSSIAVPLFLLTSLFLFFQKLQSTGFEYLRKRVQRLLEIFVFWMGFHFFIYYLFLILKSFYLGTPFSWHIPNLRVYKVILGVDPPLPVVGDSVFYFIFALILLVVISYLLFHKRTEQFKNRVSIAIIFISLIYFEIVSITNKFLGYWRLDNFLIYMPAAYFLLKKKDGIANMHIVVFYILFILFGVQDIYLRGVFKEANLYARVSVFCGAIAVFCSCLKLIESWKAPVVVKFLSKFSLGIFAIHKYWLLIITIFTLELFQLLDLPTYTFIGGLKIYTPSILAAITTALCTFVSVYILDRSLLKRYIR